MLWSQYVISVKQYKRHGAQWHNELWGHLNASAAYNCVALFVSTKTIDCYGSPIELLAALHDRIARYTDDLVTRVIVFKMSVSWVNYTTVCKAFTKGIKATWFIYVACVRVRVMIFLSSQGHAHSHQINLCRVLWIFPTNDMIIKLLTFSFCGRHLIKINVTKSVRPSDAHMRR